MIKGAEKVFFEVHGDERGSLVAIEGVHDLDFSIGRFYYIFDTAPDIVRGKHAHRNLQQVMICVHGSCDVLVDNGKEKEIVHLDNPSTGLYIHGLLWREMHHFTPDCVLCVLADKPYNPRDYIFDYEEFMNISSGGND